MKNLDNTTNTTESLDELFKKALADWVQQGRSEDEKWAVRNFATGRGIKFIRDANLLLRQEVLRGRVDTAKHFKKYMISTSPFITQIVDPYIEDCTNKLNTLPGGSDE